MSILLAALLPSLLLIGFICYKDRLQMEPPKLLIKGFFLGVLSVVPALFLEIMFDDYFQGSAAMMALSPALFEEASKMLMLWLLLRKNEYFDEYFDGIVYAVCVGVGFECTENIFYFVDDPSCMTLRILMPGHFAYAIIMGYYVGLAHFTKGSERTKNIIMAAAMPMLAHWFWDFCCFAADDAPVLMLFFFGLLIVLVVVAVKAIRKMQIRDAERRAREAAEAAQRAWQESYTGYANSSSNPGESTESYQNEDTKFSGRSSSSDIQEEHRQAFEDLKFH